MAEDAPTIVFLHDSLGCIKVWRNFPDLLCAATRCNGLIYDRQGYGESSPFTRPRELDYLEREADVLNELLVKTGVSNVILFGHSDGGSIALIFASKVCGGTFVSEPQLSIDAVITEGAHVFVEDITLDGIRAAKAVASDLLPRLQKYHGEKTQGVFAAWTETWLRPDFRDFNGEHFLDAIDCPVLVLQGVNDEYGTEAQVLSIRGNPERFPLRQMCMISEVGHTPHKDAAEKVIELCATFITAAITLQT